MRFIIKFNIPVEVGNELARSGKLGDVARSVLEAIQPEAAYFTAENGERGGTLVVNIDDASEIPAIAEPLFLAFNSNVEILPCMSPEDLGRAGDSIEESVRKFG